MPGGRVHLLWDEEDWALNEAALTWPYPDRDVLVELFKLLKRGDASAQGLAGLLQEAPGVWNRLRFEAGLRVFREVGLVDERGVPKAAGSTKFQLESSSSYRLGQSGRNTLAAMRSNNWPNAAEAL